MGETLRRTWAVTGALAAVAASSALAGAMPGASAAAGQEPPQTRIVGGSEADITEYPFTVYLADAQGAQFCGGTLVAADKVVTAAHCVADEQPDRIEVVAGRQDTRGEDGTVVGVTRIVTHPDYVGADQGADIAVLDLAGVLAERTLPYATGSDTALYEPGTSTTVLGWGATSESGSPSTTLRRAHPPLTNDADCSKANPGYSPESMVCAGVPQGGVDSCQGDSGGPLIAGDKLIGIVSWGNGCARPESPGVYTRVASYEDFLRQHVGGPTVSPEVGDQEAGPVQEGPSNHAAGLIES